MKTVDRIAVIGLGYIGLPTAIAFAQAGKQVLGVDCNLDVLATLKQGKAHIAEPHLEKALQQVMNEQRLSVSATLDNADVFIIAVPTPLQSNFQPDLSYVHTAALQIAPYLQQGNVVVLESTSPVGTTEQLAYWLSEVRTDLRFPDDVAVAYCPERVLPSNIMQEIIHNDRIIGGLSPNCTEQAVNLYKIFVKGECLTTNARTAELCKLTENSFRDVNLAFANELSMICHQLNIDVWELIRLANRHPRVQILQPSAGVGGHCIAVDPYFIVSQLPEYARLIRTAREVNRNKPQWVIEQVKLAVAECATELNCSPSQLKIACFGLTFKADIDDLRESPALQITQQLANWHSGQLFAIEPNISHRPIVLPDNVAFVTPNEALENADILVLLVNHQQFQQINVQHIQQKWIIDTQGSWQKK